MWLQVVLCLSNKLVTAKGLVDCSRTGECLELVSRGLPLNAKSTAGAQIARCCDDCACLSDQQRCSIHKDLHPNSQRIAILAMMAERLEGENEDASSLEPCCLPAVWRGRQSGLNRQMAFPRYWMDNG